eukprot:3772111-Pleurochrysis_carterae.AAC.1
MKPLLAWERAAADRSAHSLEHLARVEKGTLCTIGSASTCVFTVSGPIVRTRSDKVHNHREKAVRSRARGCARVDLLLGLWRDLGWHVVLSLVALFRLGHATVLHSRHRVILAVGTLGAGWLRFDQIRCPGLSSYALNFRGEGVRIGVDPKILLIEGPGTCGGIGILIILTIKSKLMYGVSQGAGTSSVKRSHPCVIATESAACAQCLLVNEDLKKVHEVPLEAVLVLLLLRQLVPLRLKRLGPVFQEALALQLRHRLTLGPLEQLVWATPAQEVAVDVRVIKRWAHIGPVAETLVARLAHQLVHLLAHQLLRSLHWLLDAFADVVTRHAKRLKTHRWRPCGKHWIR